MQTLAHTNFGRLTGTFQRPYRVFIDIDGVLAKCHEEALWEYGMVVKTHEWPMGKWVQQLIIENHNKKGYQVPAYIHDRNVFWGSFKSEFWSTLPLHDFANTLVEYCRSFAGDNCFLFSKPTSVGSYAGKAMWVDRFFPEFIRDNLVLGRQKEIVAPGSLLIDDSANNCRKFIKEGGQAVLVERPWNGHPTMTWENLKEAIATAFVR